MVRALPRSPAKRKGMDVRRCGSGNEGQICSYGSEHTSTAHGIHVL